MVDGKLYEWESEDEPIPRMGELLKPCPFCGESEAEVFCGQKGYYVDDKPWFEARVQCQHDTCMHELCGRFADNPREAIEGAIGEWNSRPIEQRLRNSLANYVCAFDDDHTRVGLLKEYAARLIAIALKHRADEAFALTADIFGDDPELLAELLEVIEQEEKLIH